MWINDNLDNNDTVVYTALFVNNRDSLIEKYPPVHTNAFYHHSTILFKPEDWKEGINLWLKNSINIIGRVTTDKVDVLLVENHKSSNDYPHITLSTAEWVKPFESNNEIADAILNWTVINIKDSLELTEGYFNWNEKVIEALEYTKNQVDDILN